MEKRDLAKEKVNEFLVNKFNASEMDLSELNDDSILSDLGIDSLDVVELELDFEEQLNVSISESVIIKTYGELVSLYEDNMPE